MLSQTRQACRFRRCVSVTTSSSRGRPCFSKSRAPQVPAVTSHHNAVCTAALHVTTPRLLCGRRATRSPRPETERMCAVIHRFTGTSFIGIAAKRSRPYSRARELVRQFKNYTVLGLNRQNFPLPISIFVMYDNYWYLGRSFKLG